MNLRQLELFVAVAERGSMSRGAEAVCLAQSTASQHIATLEEEAGLPLLDRAARGVALTSAGALFLEHARRVLFEREALKQAMAAFAGLESARLVVGASNIPANYLIPSLLPVLLDRYPGLRLSVATGDTMSVLDQLLRAEVELAIVGSCAHEAWLDFSALTDDPLVLVVGAGHSWTERRRIGLDDLFGEPLIVRERGSGSGEALELALQRCGVDPAQLSVAARLGSNEAVLQAVSNGSGCAFVSELSAEKHLQRGELVAIETEGLRVDRKIWLAQSRSRSLSPAAHAFVKLTSECFSAGP